MVYITGDTHGEISRFSNKELPSDSWTAEDLLIVAGDFGCIFGLGQRDEEKLEFLSHLPFQIAFLDGNHECFPQIYAYPEEMWRGGRVHRIRDNIRHLMRGQVYGIEGMRIFTMGGGYSIDKMLRIPGRSWWPEEMPSESEYAEGRHNLAAAGNEVDIIISHAAPALTMKELKKMGVLSIVFPQEAPLNAYLEEIAQNVAHKRYYFGHMHMDRELPDRRIALYHDVYCLNDGRRLEMPEKGQNA